MSQDDDPKETPEPSITRHAEWTSGDHFWFGVFEGHKTGAPISMLSYTEPEIGKGPGWHVHTYDEIFVVRQGTVLFTIGNEQIEAKAGDILFGPANIPHKYHNVGPGAMETLDIHVADTFKASRPDVPDPFPDVASSGEASTEDGPR